MGSEFRIDSGVSIPTPMLLPAKVKVVYVGSWMYCRLVELSVVSWGCVVVSLNYDVNEGLDRANINFEVLICSSDTSVFTTVLMQSTSLLAGTAKNDFFLFFFFLTW